MLVHSWCPAVDNNDSDGGGDDDNSDDDDNNGCDDITTMTLNLSSKTAPEGNDWSKSLLPIIQLLPDPETVGSISQILFREYLWIFFIFIHASKSCGEHFTNLRKYFDSQLTYLCIHSRKQTMCKYLFWKFISIHVLLSFYLHPVVFLGSRQSGQRRGPLPSQECLPEKYFQSLTRPPSNS